MLWCCWLKRKLYRAAGQGPSALLCSIVQSFNRLGSDEIMLLYWVHVHNNEWFVVCNSFNFVHGQLGIVKQKMAVHFLNLTTQTIICTDIWHYVCIVNKDITKEWNKSLSDGLMNDLHKDSSLDSRPQEGRKTAWCTLIAHASGYAWDFYMENAITFSWLELISSTAYR